MKRSHKVFIGHVTTGLHRYVNEEVRGQIVLRGWRRLHPTACCILAEQDFRIVWFRGLRAIAESPRGRGATEGSS